LLFSRDFDAFLVNRCYVCYTRIFSIFDIGTPLQPRCIVIVSTFFMKDGLYLFQDCINVKCHFINNEVQVHGASHATARCTCISCFINFKESIPPLSYVYQVLFFFYILKVCHCCSSHTVQFLRVLRVIYLLTHHIPMHI